VRLVVINLLASALFVVIQGADWHTPWSKIFEAMAVFLVFGMCIGTLAWLVLPRIAPVCLDRFVFPVNWTVLIVVYMAVATAGSVVAIAILTAVTYLRPDQILPWFVGSLKISMIMTLTIGISITLYETMRARLEAATLALRTKERDEAEARRLASEAQLATLESRVHPHFLFNTLNSIAALVHDDPAGAERMTGQLASLLRSSLDHESSSLVPLHDEIRVVRDYLEIERVRFGDRLRYEITVGNGAAGVEVLHVATRAWVYRTRRSGGIRISAERGRCPAGRTDSVDESNGTGHHS
jgi:sensor histidine kinase YesM